jgi:hypothetical protein
MKKIIMSVDKVNNDRYWEIGSNEKYWSSLDLMIEFVSLSDRLMKKIKNCEIGAMNNFVVEYEGDDFFIAFHDKMTYDDSMSEIDGYRFLDDDRIPKLKFSKENFDYVFNQWVKIKEQNSKYVIITQDDSGWIGLQGKNELDATEADLVEHYQSKK